MLKCFLEEGGCSSNNTLSSAESHLESLFGALLYFELSSTTHGSKEGLVLRDELEAMKEDIRPELSNNFERS
ncbi:hypothetical protein VNO77_37142 [Canavalia gladiata]|uniref:Uncharacterized protein n=1 Tax=Canavalia gladiata TaxID=3824 RepID=A0AAN9PY80_CANGL